MEIQNKETRVKYTMSRESWESLGKNKKLFNVLNESDDNMPKDQVIDNLVKPGTGEASKDNSTKTTTNKSRKK